MSLSFKSLTGNAKGGTITVGYNQINNMNKTKLYKWLVRVGGHISVSHHAKWKNKGKQENICKIP